MLIRSLRLMSLFALLALFLVSCSNKSKDAGSGDEVGYDYDAPLDASSGSSFGSAPAAVREDMRREDVGSRTTTTLLEALGRDASVATASGGLGIRGARGSETSVRIDAVDIAGEAVPPLVVSASTSGGGTEDLASAMIAPATTDIFSESGSGDGGEMGLLSVESVRDEMVAGERAEVVDVVDAAMITDDPEAAEEKTKIVEDVEKLKTEPAPRAGQLTAGEWSDLNRWKFWNSVTASSDWKHMNDHWGFGKGERVSVRVDNGRDPIPDAVARLYDKDKRLLWTARTDNFGRAELFTGLDKKDGDAPYEVVVASGGKESRLGGIDPSREQSPSESPLVIRLAGPAPELKVVDLMFMVDATGSMGDELDYIKSELQSVIDRVRAEMGEEFVIRLSTNVYRDKGDEYIVRSHAFDSEIESAAEFLRQQSANGGGDTPEALEAALEDAVRNHAWSESAQSRFLFFVLDAPPHYREDVVAHIRALTREASEKGIRIIGVSGSGVDKETEFLLRHLGVHTGGTYVFLTDDSGIGGSHIEPTIGSYAVEYLDDLIVRLIVQYTERPESVDAITERKARLD